MAKSLFPNAPTFIWRDDDTFEDEEHIYVSDLKAVGEIARKQEAIVAAGVDFTKVHPDANMAEAGLRVLSIGVALLADDKALVIVRWGVNDSPILDGDWLFETFSEQIRETRGYAINDDGSVGAPIKIKYVSTALLGGESEATFFGVYGNAKRFNPSMTVLGYKNIVHIVGRRQISFDEAAKMHPNPWTWSGYYVNHVNTAVAATSGGAAGAGNVIQGEFVCKSVRVYSRNRNRSLFVEAEFLHRIEGFEEFGFFIDSFDGTRPGDIVIPANMKLPWPTLREVAALPYGVIRPQTLLAPINFGASPFMFNLGGFVR